MILEDKVKIVKLLNKFSSREHSNVLRSDFDDIESKFLLYCSYLTKCYNLNF